MRRSAHLRLQLLLAFLLYSFGAFAQNPIFTENALAGNPSSEWDISGAGDLTIQGFATDISVNKGGTINFKIKSPAIYTIDIYRLGYYGGSGARKVSTSNPVVFDAVLPQSQPVDLNDPVTGKISCSNWNPSAHWVIPGTAVSGVYIAKLTKTVGGGSSHIIFVVRDDNSSSPILVKTSDATWQAYNVYGGNSLYVGSVPGYPGGHATKVSYDRPFITRNGGGGGGAAEDWIFNAEYPMIRWMERNGYDLSYTTDVDIDKDPINITPTGVGGTYNHKIILSVGHDEYWSKGERTKFENARNSGVHMAFFSGNEVYWKTRWEDNNRTLVCYKEGTLGENICGSKCDPSPLWTGLWRDGKPAQYPGSDGGKPENALTGQISWGEGTSSIIVPDTYKTLRFWRNTTVATLPSGQSVTLPSGTLGYEFDIEQAQYSSSNPAGRIILSNTGFGGTTHKLSLYRYSSGALVFGAGTVQWSWGLDDKHDRGNAAPSLVMQQATVNLFADMGVQPFSPHTGLVAVTASTDNTKPVSIISSPANGATIAANTTITISGTASDAGGGVLAGVEVSTDGGLTWQLANGTTSWNVNFLPTTSGTYIIKVRAYDDSGNMENVENANNVHTISVSTGQVVCPCTIFQPSNPSTPPAVQNDGQAITVGVKFRTTTNGYITGIRFYKAAGNTGIHVGQLWTVSGTLLASATFTGESTSGWQEVNFGTPIAITSGTTYLASYFSPNGYYSAFDNYFTSTAANGPMQGLADGVDGPNGLYAFSSVSVFPTNSFQSANYWVDAVFITSIAPDVAPPTVVSILPLNNATAVSTITIVTGTFSEAIDVTTVTTTSVFLRDGSNNLVPATVVYNAGLKNVVLTPSSPLANSTVYTATIKGGTGYDRIKDIAGNAMVLDYTWSFTTEVATPPPPPPPGIVPDEGNGGPVLLVTSSTNAFSKFPIEILRSEGWNAYKALDISTITSTVLDQYDIVLVGDIALTAAQVTLFTTWTNNGGTLIAFSPDPALSSLLGITAVSGTLADKYLKVNTTTGAGTGIVNQSIQFHGTADLFTANSGTNVIATLYSDANTATIYPAVTSKNTAANGGQAIAFMYDLAKSVVYTRQGNPAWAGQDRDGQSPIRSNDLFFGASSSDPKPDYIDLNKVDIPQADEQMHLLSNLMLIGNYDKKPLPRTWFLPKGKKAAIVMTGDDHAFGGTLGRFNQYKTLGPNTPDDVANWNAIRGTSYIYAGTPITNAQLVAFQNEGFEISLHLNTNCSDFTQSSWNTNWDDQWSTLKSGFPG